MHATTDAPPAASAPKPCCVCDAPGGKHCTKCKSRHYCSKACQLVDWYERGHKAACRQMAADFQDRMLDAIMPEKLKIEEFIEEEQAIVAGVAPSDGSKARAPAIRTDKAAKAAAVNDWHGTCVICLDVLPVEPDRRTFYECCCKRICRECYTKCREYDDRCPLCRMLPSKSPAEWLRRLQKHADEGNAQAQMQLGNVYRIGNDGLEQSPQRAFQLYDLAAAQGHAPAQDALGKCFSEGVGVQIDQKAAANWFRRAAEQGFPFGQCNLAMAFAAGHGVAQSHVEASKWWGLAAVQGNEDAIFNLGVCYYEGMGVLQDFSEALRLFERAAAQGSAAAAVAVDKINELIKVSGKAAVDSIG